MWQCYLFIFNSINDANNSSVQSSDREISERTESWRNWTYYHGMFRRTEENHDSLDIWSPGQDLNLRPLYYKEWMISTRQERSAPVLSSFHSSVALQPFVGPWPLLHFSIFFFAQTVGLLGRVINPSQGRYLHTEHNTYRATQTQNKRKHRTSMPWVGFEPTIQAFERVKTVLALDSAVTVIDHLVVTRWIKYSCEQAIHFGSYAIIFNKSRDSAFGIATSYGLHDRGVGVRVPIGSRSFSSPRRPDRLCGSPNLLSNGYWGHFPRGLSGRGVKLTSHLQLVQRSRKCGSIHPLPHTPSWRIA
jgi:hypothetical protein